MNVIGKSDVRHTVEYSNVKITGCRFEVTDVRSEAVDLIKKFYKPFGFRGERSASFKSSSGFWSSDEY